MLIPIPNIDSNYRTGKIPTAKIQYRTTLLHTYMYVYDIASVVVIDVYLLHSVTQSLLMQRTYRLLTGLDTFGGIFQE